MAAATAPAAEAGPHAGLAPLRPLLGEVNDLKRVRVAGRAGSLAEAGFLRAWAALVAGEPVARVARREAAHAVASARLGGVDAATLLDGGLSRDQAAAILIASIAEVGRPLGPGWAEGFAPAVAELVESAGVEAPRVDALPEFVGRLAGQPRAGATRPGHPRLILEPPENHAEHCYVTAVYAALAAPTYEADPSVAFLAGLAHHFHNAYLPDSGFTGEELLGPHLLPIMDRFTERAIAQLPDSLVGPVRAARAVLPDAESPEGRAFHAGDVIDRVLQMEQYSRVAAFQTRQALDDLDLVHPGPTQAFHLGVLSAVGLWPS